MRQVLNFLSDLRENNNREWFAEHKEEYLTAQATFNRFAEELIARMGEIDSSVAGLTLRDCTYRIYRDTRFSPDKSPYKTHFGVIIAPRGKKSGYCGYYFHIEPSGGNYLGGNMLYVGHYCFERDVLQSIREEVMDYPEAMAAALERAEGFALDRSKMLTRTPKGFPTGTPQEEWLRLKHWGLTRRIDEEFITAEGLAERVAREFAKTTDFLTIINRAMKFAFEER